MKKALPKLLVAVSLFSISSISILASEKQATT